MRPSQAPQKFKFFFLLLATVIIACFSSLSLAQVSQPKKTIGLAVSLGVPELLNFQAQYLKIGWLRFGYGLGTQPAKQIVSKFAKIDPASFVYSVDETYEVYPSIDFNVRTFNSYIRIFPGGGSFYLENKYVLWKIEATVNGYLRNKATLVSSSVGNISFRVLQPMLGGGVGYQMMWDNGIFIDSNLGAQYLFVPSATYWMGGLLGAGIQGSILSPEVNNQIKDTQNKINIEIDNAVRKMREQVTIIPSISLSVGWAF